MRTIEWKKLSAAQKTEALARPQQDQAEYRREAVAKILENVRINGDRALRDYTARWDGVVLNSFSVSAAEFAAAEAELSPAVKSAIAAAATNIRKFHAAGRTQEIRVETTPGVLCERLVRPIQAVGLYVPGGTAPLPSTALMLGIPAELAGCPTRILTTPPRADGSVDPHILYAAKIAGVSQVFKVGGAQAIAALAFGTESIPKVDKVFGPGNSWVTEAKIQVSQSGAAGAALDMPAGPSEVMVIADSTANPEFIALDLLSQAEHGADSQVMLVTSDNKIAQAVLAEVGKQLELLPRLEITRAALELSRIILVETESEMIAIANRYAPEHLIIQTRDPRALLVQVQSAGSVFLGSFTPESMGDYASGTNHVLPTYGYARAYSGLSVAAFERTMTVQEISPAGIRELGPVVECLATAEGLIAHKEAVSVRLRSLAKLAGGL